MCIVLSPVAALCSEANQLSEEMGKDTKFSVALQVSALVFLLVASFFCSLCCESDVQICCPICGSKLLLSQQLPCHVQHGLACLHAIKSPILCSSRNLCSFPVSRLSFSNYLSCVLAAAQVDAQPKTKGELDVRMMCNSGQLASFTPHSLIHPCMPDLSKHFSVEK